MRARVQRERWGFGREGWAEVADGEEGGARERQGRREGRRGKHGGDGGLGSVDADVDRGGKVGESADGAAAGRGLERVERIRKSERR